MPKLIINHDFDPYYHSLYIKGLHEHFAPQDVAYSYREFPKSFAHQLAFIVQDPEPRKIFVCHSDYPNYNDAVVRWSDLYAKINIDPSLPTPNPGPPVFPIGPSFGVQIYSAVRAAYRAVTSYRWGDVNPREHFANYYRQRRYRLPESAYVPGESSSSYVFFAGSLWHDDPATNAARAAFIEAGRSARGIDFEGGFTPRPYVGADPSGYAALTVEKPYSLREYLDRIKRSAVVFNTPAVGGCLGWKLGEFLALGKAIVSTSLMRVMPEPLVHAEHIHYVDGSSAAMKEAIEHICRDHDYRRKLERAARDYYLKYLQPFSVVSRILRAARDGRAAVPELRQRSAS